MVNDSFANIRRKIIMWNVNGIRQSWWKGSLKKLILLEDPDTLCLTELKCKLKDLQTKFRKIEISLRQLGYHCYWHTCETKHGYSGVAVFTKIKPIRVLKGFQQGQPDTEGRLMTLYFKRYVLVHTYVPCSGKDLKFEQKRADWDKNMSAHLKWIRESTDKPIMWSGDLNVARRCLRCR